MTYENFKTTALSSIQTYFGDNASVSVHQIVRNNNVRLDGLTIEEASVNITPTIYLNYYYDDYLAGKPFSAVLDEIIASYQKNLPDQNMDLTFFTDYNKAKYHIIFKLINYSQNADSLKEIPHFRFLDLAVVFCCFLPDTPNGNASILIQNHHLDFWHITADSLYELAVKNTPILLPYDLKSMEDVLRYADPDSLSFGSGKMQMPSAPGKPPAMYVLSNTERYYGAAVILYPQVLAFFADLQESDLYILPSSVHEVLLLPKSSCPHASGLNCIIQEVNASQVLAEEILSDHFYCFDRALGIITR